MIAYTGITTSTGNSAVQSSDIESSMVDGKFIMRNQKVLTMDEETLIEEADAVGQRAWSQVLDASPLKLPRVTRR